MRTRPENARWLVGTRDVLQRDGNTTVSEIVTISTCGSAEWNWRCRDDLRIGQLSDSRERIGVPNERQTTGGGGFGEDGTRECEVAGGHTTASREVYLVVVDSMRTGPENARWLVGTRDSQQRCTWWVRIR